MKLIFYLMLIKLINFNILSLILGFLFAIFLFKILINKPKNPEELTEKRKINLTILVPIFNEEDNLENLIKQIYSNKKYDFDVIMINDMSTDSSGKILDNYKSKYNYKIVNRTKKRGHVAGVLNDGFNEYLNNVSINSANFIGVINADCLLSDNLIDNVISCLESHDINALNLSNESREQVNIWQKIASLEKNFKNNLFYNVDASLNNGYFLKAELLKNVGKWSETELTEDLDLTLKVKSKKYHIYQSKLNVYDDVPDNIRSLLNQKYRWIKGDITNRLKKLPTDLFGVIVNIYYLFPLYTLFCILTFNFMRNIFILQFLILFVEGFIYYKFDSDKSIKKAILYPITQFLFSIYFYLRFSIDSKDTW